MDDGWMDILILYSIWLFGVYFALISLIANKVD